MTALEVAIAALAAVRLTRLVTDDTIWEGMRGRLIGWADRGGWVPRQKVGELVGCPHCVGVYASAAVVAGVDLVSSVRLPVLTAVGLAGVVSVWAEVREWAEAAT